MTDDMTPEQGHLEAAFIHPQALCESERIGDGTRVWAFAHVLPGAVVGQDCNICDHVFIENDVIVGDRVTIKCGVQLWDGLRVGSGVFIRPERNLHERSSAQIEAVPAGVRTYHHR